MTDNLNYVHYTFEDGAFGRAGVEAPALPVLPEGATEIPRADYEARLAAFAEEQEARRAATADADLQRQRDAYAAMVAVGITTDHARVLAGLAPEDLPATAPATGATPPATAPATPATGGPLVDVKLPGVGITLGGK